MVQTFTWASLVRNASHCLRCHFLMGFYVLEDFSWSFSGPFCSLGFVLACAEGLGLGVVAGIAVGCAETDETSDGTSIMLWSGPSLGLVSSEMSADSTDTDVASDVTGVTIVSGHTGYGSSSMLVGQKFQLLLC